MIDSIEVGENKDVYKEAVLWSWCCVTGNMEEMMAADSSGWREDFI